MVDAEPARRHRDGQVQYNDQLTPTNAYSPAALQQFQSLQLYEGNYPNPRNYQPEYQPNSNHASPYHSWASDKIESAFINPERYQTSFSNWSSNRDRDLCQSTPPHVSVEESNPSFGDWNLWDFSHPQSLDTPAFRTSPHLSPHFPKEHKRESSSSSHASFGGPSTPRASAGQIPSVEVFDSEGQAYDSGALDSIHWPEDIDLPVSEDDIELFHQVFGAQESGRHSEGYIQPRHLRDVQRPCDPRIRQLMMSQESTASSSRMGPPALPRTESTDTDGGCRPSDPSLPKLDRTMSDIYQDSLYNPNLRQSPESPTQPHATNNNDSSPNANMIRERLAAANSDHLKAISQSPINTIARERSPFKPHAPESPRENQFPRDGEPPPRLGSAYRMREWEKAQRDRAAAAQHQPSQIKSELNDPPKTISPKEVALDYEEDETASKMGSLFSEEPLVKRRKQEHSTVPSLKPAMTRESTRGSNASEISQPSFGSMATSRRESSQSNGRSQMNYPFFAQAQRQASNASNATAVSETTNDFPAHLTSGESTKSDQEPSNNRKRALPSSLPRTKSNDSDVTGGAEPEDFTYTCTYHGCTQRFESQSALQKHKRDIHHSTAHHSRNTSLAGASASPVASSRAASVAASTTPVNAVAVAPAPDPAELEGHAASPGSIADRNSQAGPHICNRINPSTGRPCNSQFSRPYDLTRHEDTIHNNKKQKVRCMYCKDEKTFSRNDALTRHMRVVHPDVQFAGKEKKSGR